MAGGPASGGSMTDAYGLLKESLDAWCLLHGAEVVEQKEIPYGRQMVVSGADNTVTVNMYATGKVMVQGKPSALKEEVIGWMGNPAAAVRARPRASASAPLFDTASAPRITVAGVRPPASVAEPQIDAVAEPKIDAVAEPPERAVDVTSRQTVSSAQDVTSPPRAKKDYTGGHIGIDESGKGDYFGPLVIAAACIGQGDERWLSLIGVRDCKELSDAKVLELLPKLKAALPNKIIIINPVRYNALHAKMKNLNILLAWGHARCLEDLVNETGATTAVSDKFSNKGHLDRALMTAGRGVELVQRTKAEDDPAVAAASVLARGEFLNALAELGKKWGVKFPKGASSQVDAAAKRFVKEFGMERLGEVAKVHFKTTLKISGK